MSQVQNELAKYLEVDDGQSLGPLDFAQKGEPAYKESWSITKCQRSLTTQGHYEAAGNLFWVRLKTSDISLQGLSLQELSDAFDKMVDPKTSLMSFPSTFEIILRDQEGLANHFPKNCDLIEPHPLLACFYLGVAINALDWPRLLGCF